MTITIATVRACDESVTTWRIVLIFPPSTFVENMPASDDSRSHIRNIEIYREPPSPNITHIQLPMVCLLTLCLSVCSKEQVDLAASRDLSSNNQLVGFARADVWDEDSGVRCRRSGVQLDRCHPRRREEPKKQGQRSKANVSLSLSPDAHRRSQVEDAMTSPTR